MEARAASLANADILGALPRPLRLGGEAPEPPDLAQRSPERFRTTPFRVFRRLLRFAPVAISFLAAQVWDRVRGRSSPLRTGRRLRARIEKLGGTFVKLGQQLSLRHDLLRSDTCFELGRLLDDMPAMPSDIAVREIENATGRSMRDLFRVFDPDPIGSASLACVYQAELRSGERVAVKVRRPGVGDDVAADLRIISSMLRMAELMTVIRPGTSDTLREGLRTMLFEELDFRVEARFQEILRRRAKEDGLRFLYVPKVYPELSCARLLVSELLTGGIWLIDLLGAIESDRPEHLHFAREAFGIKPKKVAKRLLRIRHWSLFENLFFHADPHPGNVMVLPKNRLAFVDFGACAPATRRTRTHQVEMFRRQARGDVEGMVQVFHSMFSPLPRVDIDALTARSEAATFEWMYGFETEHVEWFERTSASLWLSMFAAIREFDIPVSLETIRTLRSSLLYDTITARLSPDANMLEEFRRYERRARRQALRRFIANLDEKLSIGWWLLEIERQSAVVGRLWYRLSRYADAPLHRFLSTAGKMAETTATLLRATLVALVYSTIVVGVVSLTNQSSGGSLDIRDAMSLTAQSPWFVAGLLIILVRTYRAVQFRLADVDT
ncbi:MAG: AarF/ABC1/UbiB kinase family protein [Gemmatimonadetes bacterium]|nr:AarF/ABC1/UbiB kinase family protein [Gemmatimonadota bacterium]